MKTALLLLLGLSLTAQAATIAIIDSGVDVEHKDFEGKIWINSNEIPDNGRDEDRNGYQDDVYGWNFAEQNNKVIDRKYIGSFSKDPYAFFDIQGKIFIGTATEQEKEWIAKKRQDQKFIQELSKFGNFVHGTHVAGIAQEVNDEAKILSVKLIPTEVKPFARNVGQNFAKLPSNLSEDIRMQLLKAALDKLGEQQMELLEEIAHYVGSHKAHIANGSFGTSSVQAKMITDTIFKIFFFRAPKPEESEQVVAYFINGLIKQGEKMVGAAKKTLFVFAAGNDGTNNDKYPVSPANIHADNVITVAATYDYKFLAPFSNYGVKEVDVAAPGMLVHSQIPGNEYLKVSGTSQAAPFVSNVAARIVDINPALTPAEIKKIIVGTVDLKDFLQGKLKAPGIVNPKRAETAAQMSLSMSVEEAVSQSLAQVADVNAGEKSSPFEEMMAGQILVLPLPSLFR